MIRNAKIGERVRVIQTPGEMKEWTGGKLTGHWPDGCQEGVVKDVLFAWRGSVRPTVDLIYVQADHPKAVGTHPFRPKELERVKS